MALPPRRFFDYFSLFASQLAYRAPGVIDIHEDAKRRALTILEAIAVLARSYDVRTKARYAANVMLVVPNGTFGNSDLIRFDDLTEEDINQFMPDDSPMTDIAAVLFLVAELSMTDEGQPDDALEKRIVLPIPSAYSSEDTVAWRLLPGAPVAYMNWRATARTATTEDFELRLAAHGIDDIHNIEKYRLKTNPKRFEIDSETLELDDDVVAKLKGYFCAGGSGEQVRSLISFPLVKNDGNFEAIGTLNLHCDSSTLLGAPEGDAFRRREVFASVIAPFIFELAEAVTVWSGSTARS